MTRSIRARYTNGTLVPLEPLDLEEGAEVTVSVEPAPSEPPHKTPKPMQGLAGVVERVLEMQEGYSSGGVGRSSHRPRQEQETLSLRSSQGRGVRAELSVVFADAGYWIALWNPRDNLHNRALTVANVHGATRVVTTQMALTETLDAMAGMGEFRRQLAIRMLRDLDDDPSVDIVPQTDSQFRASVERYAARSDQSWSLTDCASFLVMEGRGITDALAYDRDFVQAGFVALLRDG